MKDPDGRYMLINKEFTRRYGVGGDEILGSSNEERFPAWEQAWAASRAQEKDVADSGKITTREQDRQFADGSHHRLEIVKFPISDDGGRLIGVGALGVDITERDKWERDALDRERVLKGYHKALDRIVASDAMASPNAGDAFSLLTQVAAETLGVERVSVWRARPDMSQIECLDLYQATAAAHSSGMILEHDYFPQYFKALQQVEVIDAHDARSDPRTAEFTGKYLDGHGITSMLDAVIHVGDELKGVLCLEHVGDPREWTLEEQSLARSLAALTSLIMARQEQQESNAPGSPSSSGSAVSSTPCPVPCRSRTGTIAMCSSTRSMNGTTGSAPRKPTARGSTNWA
ncbi:PAS domain-containing protein [Thalassospiraceae bacterium LMO-SO8]|nr:PAS domain-containing protein [Thalassospiraceae bacterium LMO-SO8]